LICSNPGAWCRHLPRRQKHSSDARSVRDFAADNTQLNTPVAGHSLIPTILDLSQAALQFVAGALRGLWPTGEISRKRARRSSSSSRFGTIWPYGAGTVGSRVPFWSLADAVGSLGLVPSPIAPPHPSSPSGSLALPSSQIQFLLAVAGGGVHFFSSVLLANSVAGLFGFTGNCSD